MRTVTFLAALAGAQCGPSAPAAQPTTAASPAAHIPAPAPRVADPVFRGLVAPRRTIEIRSVAGGVITAFPFGLGDPIAAHDHVATLDNAELRQRLRLAEADVRSARADLSRARGERDFTQRQAAQVQSLDEIVAGDERKQAEHRAAQSQASASAADGDLGGRTAELDRLRALVDGLSLDAPFDAELAAVYRDVGQTIGPGETVARLVSTQRVLRFAVDGPHVAAIAVGTRVEFTPEGSGQPLPARVTALAPELDAAGLVIVEAVFTRPGDTSRIGVHGHVRLRS